MQGRDSSESFAERRSGPTISDVIVSSISPMDTAFDRLFKPVSAIRNHFLKLSPRRRRYEDTRIPRILFGQPSALPSF